MTKRLPRPRHHCNHCNSRVVPYDQHDANVLAPAEDGDKPILLRSHNARSTDDRLAWCWSCEKLVNCTRLSATEILRMYLARDGVTVRPHKNRRKR